MLPTELSFAAPTTVAEAVAELDREGSVAIAGGTSAVPALKDRAAEVRHLVYLGRIAELSGITRLSDGTVKLGAATTLRELSRSSLVRSELLVLAAAAERLGNPRVRAVATVGGAVAQGDPRQDLSPVLLALEARVRIAGPSGPREVAMSEFFVGPMETVLEHGELIVSVLVPTDPAVRAFYARFTPGSAENYPLIGVAVAMSRAPDGTIEHANVALAGAAPTAILVDKASALLKGRTPDSDLVAAVALEAAAAARPPENRQATAEYKRDMIEVWTRRALEGCIAL